MIIDKNVILHITYHNIEVGIRDNFIQIILCKCAYVMLYIQCHYQDVHIYVIEVKVVLQKMNN